MYTERNVTFEDNPSLACVGMHLFHLAIEQILHEIVEGYILVGLATRIGKDFAVFLIPSGMLWPLGEVGRAVGVAQMAILGIRN